MPRTASGEDDGARGLGLGVTLLRTARPIRYSLLSADPNSSEAGASDVLATSWDRGDRSSRGRA